jgi:crossover junction endodeoxyribonuclease RuvC
LSILGIDPGFDRLGWAVIEDDLRIRGYGLVKTRPGDPFENRLLQIHESVIGLIDEYKPDVAAIERLYFSRNTRTAMDVAKCIGVILLAFRMSSIPSVEYSPVQVKQAITGYGRAEKDQVSRMVRLIYRLDELPGPDDIADALAIAACHTFSVKTAVPNGVI